MPREKSIARRMHRMAASSCSRTSDDQEQTPKT